MGLAIYHFLLLGPQYMQQTLFFGPHARGRTAIQMRSDSITNSYGLYPESVASHLQNSKTLCPSSAFNARYTKRFHPGLYSSKSILSQRCSAILRTTAPGCIRLV